MAKYSVPGIGVIDESRLAQYGLSTSSQGVSQYSDPSQPAPIQQYQPPMISSPSISYGSLSSSPSVPNVPQPINTAPQAYNNLNVAASSVNGNFQPQDYGNPIVGNPTVPFITVGGKNYASNPADRTYNSAGGQGSTPQPQQQTTNQNLSERSGIQNRLLELLGIQGTQAQRTQDILKEGQVDVKKQALTDLQNTALTLKSSYDNQIQTIRQENVQGQLSGAQQQQITQLTRDRDRALADNSIQQLVAQNNYNAALDLAKLKIDAEFKPIENQINTLKTYFSIFQDDMTEKEKFEAQNNIKQQEQSTKDLKDAKQNAVDTLVKSGQYTQEKANLINNAQTAAEVNQALVGDGSGGENSQLYTGLSSSTSTAVRGQVSAFKTEPIVTNFATIQEGKNFVDSISSTTKNPADDQALIYSLAKVLDPNSVVREGEYATAQKYAQSWVNSFGKSVTQAIAGTGFLSEEARRNIKATINTRYNASLNSYNNLYSRYATGINDLTGRSDGEKFLKDYRASSNPTNTTSNANDPLNLF